ncbi:MAG TPA: amidohydrolase family protein, partial [Pseudolabrys sp.]
PERMSIAGAPYDDVVPFAKTLVEKFPDRVIWGTDWPHPNHPGPVPDDGVLVDILTEIAPSDAARQAILVDNPQRFYRFAPARRLMSESS